MILWLVKAQSSSPVQLIETALRRCRIAPQYAAKHKTQNFYGYLLVQYSWLNIMLITIILGRRKIRDLPMKCDNVERGCQWEGTFGTLEEHVDGCQFTLVPCPKKCKDDKITRRDLKHHLMEKCPNRDYSCEHCD